MCVQQLPAPSLFAMTIIYSIVVLIRIRISLSLVERIYMKLLLWGGGGGGGGLSL